MSPGHKNPQMPAKPRMEPLAGRGWEGCRLVCSGLDGAGAPRPALLSAHEEAASQGRGGVQDRLCSALQSLLRLINLSVS